MFSEVTSAIRRVSLLLFATPVLIAAPVNAQDQEGVRGIEEIVVTARKREETLQDVPIAVTALSGVRLEELGAGDIADIQAYVPNISIYPGRNQSTTLTAFIRGIGQADPLWGVDPGVGLYLDDVYIARPQGALLDVFDVQRVEVLRGPQGTLYGKNTIGGAIKYVTRPLTDDLEFNVSAAAGDYSTRNFKARLGGALIPGTLRAKVAVASLQHDGYGDNLLTGAEVSDKDTTAYRLALEWLPTDNLSFVLSYDNTEDDASPKGYKRLEANPLCPVFLGESCPPLSDPFDVEAGLEPLNGTDSEGVSLTVQWGLSDSLMLKSITADRESDSRNNIDFDTTPARITDVIATYFDEQTTQEFQLIYDAGGKLDGVVGLFYLDGKAGGLVQNIFFDSIFGTTDGDTETTSYAVFGEGSYALSDALNVNFGLRYTDEEKCGRAFNAGYADDSFEEVTAVTADYDKCETFTSVSPKLGVDWSASDDVLLYATVSRGFKSGGFNVRAQSTFFPESAEPFDDEELTSYEVGAKTTWLDGQAVFNAALFYGDYTDVQVSTFEGFDSTGDGVDDSFFGNFVNGGDATIKGVETEFVFSPRSLPWLSFNGMLNFLDAEPDDFLDENNNRLVDTQVITNAPDVTASLNANMNFDVMGGSLYANLGVSYRDDSTLTNEGEGVEPLVQPAFSVWNATLGFVTGDERWRFAVNGRNLGDKEYLTNGYNIPVLGIKTGSVGAPRVVTLTVEYSFF